MGDEVEHDDGFDKFERTRDVILLTLLAAEVGYLWLQYKDTPTGLLYRSKFQTWLAKVAGRCPKCREYREAKAQMFWQAHLAKDGLKVDERGVVVEDEHDG